MANTNNSTATTFNTSTAPTTLQTSMLSSQSQNQSSSRQKYSQMMNHNNLIPSPLREQESYNSYNHSHHPTFLSSSFQSPPASKNTILSHTQSQQQEEEQQTPLIKNTNSSQSTRQHSVRFSFNVNNNKSDDKDNRISTEEKEVVRKLLVLDQNVGMRKDEMMKNCNDNNDSTKEIQQEMQSQKTQQNHNDGEIINDNVTGQDTFNANLTNNNTPKQQQQEQQKERPLKKRKSLKTPSNNKSPYSERKKRRISIFGSLERTLWSSLYDVSSSLCTPQSSID
eukprot:CAMPEP_0178963162 /NCGR_PEP_ID=MMETSP0789-20121207/14844_1 /TAXON_ID=3005 /ORGANISM="Rhizosolenia setigera, Strain CCMP 1694" /LENGTH=280 /DNA_ID=CAMNT_0020647547 /DNA_START=62 /DNA_END=904 /DNA_ORIENTATION=-